MDPYLVREKLPHHACYQSCFDLVGSWLEECAVSHPTCGEEQSDPSFYPTRLIDVGLDLQGDLCYLRDCGKEPPKSRYITLSHCWGAGTFSQLTEATKGRLERGVSIRELSQTFRDAILLVRWLKVRYIWIDALCIIQDSEGASDWTREAAQMGKIYSRSLCTIAATHTANGQGFLSNRDISAIKPCRVKSKGSRWGNETYTVLYDDYWSNNLLATPLHNRAWVLQERLLSQRVIHFGGNQIFWECRHMKASETYPHGLPTEMMGSRTENWRILDFLPSNKPADIPEYDHENLSSDAPTRQLPKCEQRLTNPTSPYAIWSKIVERYMECKLSKPRDKLVAIAGIADRVRQVIQEPYLAGLWDNPELAIQLLWYVLTRRQADGSLSEESLESHAPTWSWAHLDAMIVWEWPTGYDDILVDINKSSPKPGSGARPSEITSGALEIYGRLFEAEIGIAKINADGTKDEDGTYYLLVGHEIPDGCEDQKQGKFYVEMPMIHLDTSLGSSSTTAVYCLPICTGWKGSYGNGSLRLTGLILERSNCDHRQYKRMGIFGLNEVESCHLTGLDPNESFRLEEMFALPLRQTIKLV